MSEILTTEIADPETRDALARSLRSFLEPVVAPAPGACISDEQAKRLEDYIREVCIKVRWTRKNNQMRLIDRIRSHYESKRLLDIKQVRDDLLNSNRAVLELRRL